MNAPDALHNANVSPPLAGHHPLQLRATRLWQRAPLQEVGAERLAQGLAWFGLALGIAELFAPRQVARVCGGEGRHRGLMRLYGLREIGSSLMILSQGKRPAAGVWTRVAGDALDLATLAASAASPRMRKKALAAAGAGIAAVAAVDWLCARELSRRQGLMTDDGAIRVRRSIAINRPADEIYRFWRDVENLPRFMYHLKSVRSTSPGRSHWVTSGPAGSRVEWESEIVDERVGELIAWRSVAGSQVENAGCVGFEPRPGGRGSIVRVDLAYRPPGGVAGAAVASVFNRSAQQQLHDDLCRLKQLLETGEIVRSDGSPDGTGSVAQRPAQPLGEREERPQAEALHAAMRS